VRLPLNKIGSLNKINKTFSKLEQEYEREPSVEEIAKAMEMSEQEVSDALKTAGRHISMDAPLADDSDAGNLYDVYKSNDLPSPDEALLNESLRKEIERILHTLPGREADIVRYFYGISGHRQLTLDEIGMKFDLTRERVRQIKEKAIRRLKLSSKSRNLKAYLG
jgi:RNA polymerase primary sigma factor